MSTSRTCSPERPKAPRLSRRRFLLQIGALLGLAAVRCVAKPSPAGVASPTSAPTATSIPTTTPAKVSTVSPSSIPTSKVRVALARGDSVAEMVRQAVDLAGGLPNLKPGATVLIKPNVNSEDPYPGTTNPQVVRAVIDLVKGYNPAHIMVADRSNPDYDTIQAMQEVGIYNAAVEAGAEVRPLDDESWEHVSPEGAQNWPGGFEFAHLALEADYLITLPVTKTHFIANYTMALKNTVGIIHPQSRELLHSRGGYQFGAMIAELNLARPADFVIMDGTRAFISGGPSQGELREPNLILATSDLVAADVVGLAILKSLGSQQVAANSWEEPQIMRAVELGLGVKDAGQIDLTAQGVLEIEDIRAFL